MKATLQRTIMVKDSGRQLCAWGEAERDQNLTN